MKTPVLTDIVGSAQHGRWWVALTVDENQILSVHYHRTSQDTSS